MMAQPLACLFDLNHDGGAKRRSRRAVVTTGSPKTSPHSAKPRFEIRIKVVRYCGASSLATQRKLTGYIERSPVCIVTLKSPQSLPLVHAPRALPQTSGSQTALSRRERANRMLPNRSTADDLKRETPYSCSAQLRSTSVVLVPQDCERAEGQSSLRIQSLHLPKCATDA